MIRKLSCGMIVLASLCSAAISSPSQAGEIDAAVVALKAGAEAHGRVRVIVELRVVEGRGGEARLRRLQREVVEAALGKRAWRLQGRDEEPHGVSPMRWSPMFAAAVTATEIDRLIAHPAVRRVVGDGLAAPN